ncbi:Uu.00g007690.m01.CDS01 [Anthostomella pinea]|uniref:Kinesin-like protein n=1 Tax=Anthostomella pinea TaxID=933095 RepID=A0AAI8YPV6_9PEZI|nr:Uu.00g007690.m01.CDS01 [Anthostomella pinea]
MEPPQRPQASLFQVYLRLRPPQAGNASAERAVLVEEPEQDNAPPTHITLNPPNDRRRAIEKFAFTRVFEEDATQLDLFQGTRVLPLVEAVLAPHGGDGTDGLLATLGVTGSGKTHTMLGSRSQRGLTQLALDVVYRSIDTNIVDCDTCPTLEAGLRSADASEAAIYSAPAFLENVYSDFKGPSRAGSRAATPMIVRPQHDFIRPSLLDMCPQLPGHFPDSPNSVRLVCHEDDLSHITMLSTPPSQRKQNMLPLQMPVASSRPKLAYASPQKKHYMSLTSTAKSKNLTKTPIKGDYPPPPTPRRQLQRPSALPQMPDISSIRASIDPSAEYAIVISMYEVYNDRIFDLLTPPVKSNATKEYRRRALLFKPTESSPDRKVVAGLRKVICGNLREALMVLEAGLHERRVAGTGSNSSSSRSHGFFCVEVKKRRRGRTDGQWGTSTLSIVDLAGSERARDAKTQGATLAEAGKINESLMYLGQCLQMQSDASSSAKPNLVPFRQCKLTELLFSNSFPSASVAQSVSHRRAPQKAVMIVTADPLGDFNATSQILRYSALAREVTVPRIPSITSTILANASSTAHFHLPEPSPGCSSPLGSPQSHHRPFFQQPSATYQRTFSPMSDTERATMENAAMEIARMADMIDQLNAELSRESEGRMAAEAHLLSMEDRVVELEQEIREECYADFEHRLALEMGRWKASLSLEQERGEEHWDRKIEVLARSVSVVLTAPSDEDDVEDEDKENVLIENLEQENDRLRREVAVLKRELSSRTPSKRAPLQERGDVSGVKADIPGLGSKMEQLRVSGSRDERAPRVTSTGSPTKKMRKLPAKKWDSIDVDDDLL